MTRSILLSFALAAAVGCYSDIDAFTHRLAHLSCVNVRECMPVDFDATYHDLDACVDDVEPVLGTFFASCTYDPERGRPCIHAIYARRKDCESFGATELPQCEGALICDVTPLAGQLSLHPIARSAVSALGGSAPLTGR